MTERGGSGRPGRARRPVRVRRLQGGRPHKFTVRFSDAEFVRIEARARAAGVSVSRLLFESGLTGDARTVIERRAVIDELLGVRRLLAAVGNNLNQLARVVNATGQERPEIGATIQATFRVIRRIDAATAPLTGLPAGGDGEDA